MYTEVVASPGLSSLLQDRVKLRMVDYVPPTSTPSRWFHSEPKEGVTVCLHSLLSTFFVLHISQVVSSSDPG